MTMRIDNERLTVCEVLRQINDRLQGEEHADIRDMLALAEQMAKKMSAKLREYVEDYDSDWWKENVLYNEWKEREKETYCTGDPERARAMLERK